MVRSRVHDEYEWERAEAHEVDEADRMSIQVTIDSRTENPRVGGSIPPLATILQEVTARDPVGSCRSTERRMVTA